MRVLFYLPVVTPWWFDHIVAPLIRRLAEAAEVHVLAPVPWSGTGLGEEQLQRCADLSNVQWHIVDGADHPSMRIAAVERDAIVGFVQSLAPDYVLCRSADCATVRQFPGVVRHIMEGGAAPLAVPPDWVVLQEEPFDHGCMPAIDADARAELDTLVAPLWGNLEMLAEPGAAARAAFRDWAGIPDDRPVLLLPLEYEHAENFYPIHRVGATPNARLIAELAEQIDDRFFIAVTNHPLNELHVDNAALEAEVARHGDRMQLVPSTTPSRESATSLLASEVQGMLLGDSKVYSVAGFAGTPILRRSHFKTGAWLNAYADFEPFLSHVAAGDAETAAAGDARAWFAFHIANNLIDPNDDSLTAAALLAHLDRPVDRTRWEAGFARYRAAAPGHFQ